MNRHAQGLFPRAAPRRSPTTHLALHHFLELGQLLESALGLLVRVGLQLVLQSLAKNKRLDGGGAGGGR